MKKFTIVLALLIISIVCCAGCINPQEPVVPVDPVDPITPIEPVEPELPVEEYSVMFMMNYDGAGAYTAETVKAGERVSKPANPSRSGYTFNGWFTEADGGAVYDFTQAINSDVTLYAQWSKKKSSSSSGSSTPQHKHTYKWKVVKVANCTVDGLEQNVCSCGVIESTKKIDATGHSYSEFTKDGQTGVLCSVCDDFQSSGILIGNVLYSTFAEAMDAAEDTNEVDMITLIGGVESVDVTQDVIIDLNGQAVTLNYGESTPIKIKKDGYSKGDVTVKVVPDTAKGTPIEKTVNFEEDVTEEAKFLSDEESDLLTVAYAINEDENLYDAYSAYGLENIENIIYGQNNEQGESDASWHIALKNDIDLGKKDQNGNSISFNPIGSTGEYGDTFISNDVEYRSLITEPFKGTFDGQGHTISNLHQSGWDFGYLWGHYGSIGLFSELEGATVKNVVLEGFECQIEGGDISFIAGSATGECTFENIEIKNGKIGTYNNGIGGIIGWSGAGTYTFKNITIGEDVVLGGLWGSYDSSVGGIVGQAEPGATYKFENVDIACRLDVYNDCTASYDYYNYRMCGMIIGRLEETTTIDGVNYPDTSKYNINCKDVTVTYGEWANYHYCEPTPGHNNGRGMRVEPGFTYGGLPADFDHTQCTTNHMACIPFDQLFGGDQYGVKGLKEYAGVTVVYPEEYTCPLCDIPHNTS